MDSLEDFLDLVLPSSCALCNTAGANLCQECKAKLALSVIKVNRLEISGYATTTYTEQIAILIHEFKESQQTSLAKVFAQAMLPAFSNFDLQECGLVFMPSKNKSFANRGFVPAKILATRLSRLIAKQHKVLVPVYNGLGYSPAAATQIDDQAALSGQDRRTNLIGKMQTRGIPKFYRAILIDDVVTTGSTLTEAKRALGAIGVEVLGFVAFAETLPKNKQNRHKDSV